METIEIIFTAGFTLLGIVMAGIWRSLDTIHKRIEKRDEEIKELDKKVDGIDNRLVRIETKLDAHT